MLFILFLLLPAGANAEHDSSSSISKAVTVGTLLTFVILSAAIGLVVWRYSRRSHPERDGAETPVVWQAHSSLLVPLTAPMPSPPSSPPPPQRPLPSPPKRPIPSPPPQPPPAAHAYSPTRNPICTDVNLCFAQTAQPSPLPPPPSYQQAPTGVVGLGTELGACKPDTPEAAAVGDAHSQGGSQGAVGNSRWV